MAAGEIASPQLERGAVMTGRVRIEAGYWLPKEDTHRVAAAVGAAIAGRERVVRDEHDPRYLHPARCVLILISDAAVRSADVLAAAAFVDSVDVALAPDPATLRALGCAGAAELVERVPRDVEDDELLEALVSVPDDVALIALAERLDQARHLQFRHELDWRRFHAGVEAAWIPAAQRFSPPLARRFERWAEAFRRRLLLRG